MVGFPLYSPQRLIYHYSHLTSLKIKVSGVLSDNQRPLGFLARKVCPGDGGYNTSTNIHSPPGKMNLLVPGWDLYSHSSHSSHPRGALFPDFCGSSQNLETTICEEKQHPRLCQWTFVYILWWKGSVITRFGNCFTFSLWDINNT